MRIVQNSEEFVEALLGAKREAAASFGIDTVLLEKYITQPRHVEVQVKFSAQGILISHTSLIMYLCHFVFLSK